MDVHRAARHAYDWVNLAGKLNDVVLDSEVLTSGAVRSRALLRRRQAQRGLVQRSRAQRAADGLRDGATSVGSQARFTLGLCLAAKRTIPFFWGGATPFLAHTALGVAAPLYPLAETVVGRGHSGRHAPPTVQVRFFEFFSQMHHEVSRFGLLGLAFEGAPLQAAQAARRRGYHKLATACLVAAVLGRLVLQPVRLAVAGAALVNEAVCAVLTMAILTAIELGLRHGRVALTQASTATGRPLAGARNFVSGAIDGLELA